MPKRSLGDPISFHYIDGVTGLSELLVYRYLGHCFDTPAKNSLWNSHSSCPNCGAEKTFSTSASSYCPECGVEFSIEFAKCLLCGNRLIYHSPTECICITCHTVWDYDNIIDAYKSHDEKAMRRK